MSQEESGRYSPNVKRKRIRQQKTGLGIQNRVGQNMSQRHSNLERLREGEESKANFEPEIFSDVEIREPSPTRTQKKYPVKKMPSHYHLQ